MTQPKLPPYPRPPEEDLYSSIQSQNLDPLVIAFPFCLIARLQDDLVISTKQANSWSRKLEAIRGKMGESSR